MYKILINYNFTPEKEWIGNNYLIYDRSDDGIEHLKDFDQSKIIKSTNTGQVDYDKLSYLVDNYDNLPEVFLWGKSNLFKFITKKEFDEVRDNSVFTPLLTKYHKTYSDRYAPVCFYLNGMYYERNNSWYVNELEHKYFDSYSDFAHTLHIRSPQHIPFAPGGNYILTRETVHKYSRDFYDDLRQLLPYTQNPAEAHMCERAYYLIWSV